MTHEATLCTTCVPPPNKRLCPVAVLCWGQRGTAQAPKILLTHPHFFRLLVELIGSVVISLSRCCLTNDEGPGPPIFFCLDPPLVVPGYVPARYKTLPRLCEKWKWTNSLNPTFQCVCLFVCLFYVALETFCMLSRDDMPLALSWDR